METATVPARLGYRPALDGLRAISVLAVMVGHARQSFLPGSFLGVEAFFVLSGFLITALMLEEHDKSGRVSLTGFYARRARRLFPALGALLLFCLGMGLWGDGELVDRTARAVLPVGLYVANWAKAFGADLGGLNHMWSLAIEEQFYLLWPLVMVGLLRLQDGRKRALLLTLVAAVAVLLVRSAAVRAGVPSERIYSGLDTRAGGVLIGCALALARSLGVVPRFLEGKATAALGAVVVVSLMATWSPGYFQAGFLLAQLGVAFVLHHVISRPAGRYAAVLGAPALVWIGRLSYGLYLWHFTIFYFLRVEEFPVRLGTAVVLTFAAAMASARFVERPFLKRKPGPEVRPVTATRPAPSVVAG